MGRHQINIDWARVIELGMAGNGVAQIAGLMGLNRQSLCYRCQKDFACTVKELISCGPMVLGGGEIATDEAEPVEPAENSSSQIPDLIDTRGRIQWDPIQEALAAGATDEDILCLTGKTRSELDKSSVRKNRIPWERWAGKIRASLDIDIRRAQLAALRSGNVSMLQLLGRERLGQGAMGKNDKDITEIRLVLCHGPDELKEVIASNKRAMDEKS